VSGIQFLIAAVFLELTFVLLGRFSASQAIPETILLLVCANTFWIVSVYFTLHTVQSTKTVPVLIIVAAAAFRITAWPVAAPLTDDLYRYRWEARVQNEGGNPYASRPADPDLTRFRDSTWSRVGQKDVPAGYGPAWELLGAWTGRLSGLLSADPDRQAFWFKLPAAVFELGTLVLVAVWLRRAGLPGHWLAVYAWSPLPVWEFWAGGHNDAPVLFCVTLALLLADSRRWAWSWGALGMAVALKFWPAILMAAWVFRAPRYWWKGPAVAMAVVAVCALPYAGTDVWWNARYMTGFVGGWRNNDSLFGAILWVTGDQYRAKYTAFALISACALWFASRREWPLGRVVLWTCATLLLLSSNCHPWYLTWLVPMLAFAPASPVMLWMGLMPISYAVWIDWSLLREWNGSTPLRWLVYGPTLAYFLVWLAYFRSRDGSQTTITRQ